MEAIADDFLAAVKALTAPQGEGWRSARRPKTKVGAMISAII